MKKLLFFSLLFFTFLSPPVFADLIDPTEEACTNSNEGDSCGDRDGIRDGTCQPAECCRLDYSNGTPPETVCNDCLKCQSSSSTSDSVSEGGMEVNEETMTDASDADENDDSMDSEEAESCDTQKTSPSFFGLFVAALGLLLSVRLYHTREE